MSGELVVWDDLREQRLVSYDHDVDGIDGASYAIEGSDGYTVPSWPTKQETIEALRDMLAALEALQ